MSNKIEQLQKLANDQSTTIHERNAAKRALSGLKKKRGEIIEQSTNLTIADDNFEMPPWVCGYDTPDEKWRSYYNFLFKFHVRLIGFEIRRDDCGRYITHDVNEAMQYKGRQDHSVYTSFSCSPHPVYDRKKYVMSRNEYDRGELIVARDEFYIRSYSLLGILEVKVYPNGVHKSIVNQVYDDQIDIFDAHSYGYREGPWWSRLEELSKKWSAEADEYDLKEQQRLNNEGLQAKRAENNLYGSYLKTVRK